jgi:D-proline reductase (dithiol) PrdB
VGLVQRRIEAAGTSTICLSNIAAFTASVGAPRVAAIEHPGSQPLGPPGDAERQREILAATLDALLSIETPGQVVDLPFEWPKGVRRGMPRKLPPIAKLLMLKPWLLPRFASGDIPDPK